MPETNEERIKRLERVSALTEKLHALETLLIAEDDLEKRKSYEAEMMDVIEAIRKARLQ